MKREDIQERGKYRAMHHIRNYPAVYRVDAIIVIPSRTMGRTIHKATRNGKYVTPREIKTKSKVIYKVTCLDDGLQTAFRSHKKFICKAN